MNDEDMKQKIKKYNRDRLILLGFVLFGIIGMYFGFFTPYIFGRFTVIYIIPVFIGWRLGVWFFRRKRKKNSNI